MIIDRQRRIRIARKPLERFLHLVRKELKLGNAEVSIAFVTDAEIARLNKTYRRKSGPTDVLSFPARVSTTPGRLRRIRSLPVRRSLIADRSFLGDIAIAPAVACRYAAKNNRPLPVELRVLILHGVLHLMGYDHETDRGQMDRIEQKLRRRLGLA